MQPDTIRLFAKNLTPGLEMVVGGRIVTIVNVEPADPPPTPPGFPAPGAFVRIAWGEDPGEAFVAGEFQPYDVLVPEPEEPTDG